MRIILTSLIRGMELYSGIRNKLKQYPALTTNRGQIRPDIRKVSERSLTDLKARKRAEDWNLRGAKHRFQILKIGTI